GDGADAGFRGGRRECGARGAVLFAKQSRRTRYAVRAGRRRGLSRAMANDPIEQFHIEPIAQFEIAGLDASFTNASLAMVAGAAVAAWFFNWAMKPAALVPGRAQVVAEGAYGFIRGMLHDAAGDEGVKKFLPFVFTLFLFIFMANMLGMFPGF